MRLMRLNSGSECFAPKREYYGIFYLFMFIYAFKSYLMCVCVHTEQWPMK